jgi:hypothetical protein
MGNGRLTSKAGDAICRLHFFASRKSLESALAPAQNRATDANVTPHQNRISRRINMLGTVVLAAGLSVAAVVYWTGRAPAVSSQPDEPLATLDSKVDNRALEENQGKTGVLMVRLEDELQQPGPLALIFAILAILAALVCFRIAGWFASGPDDASSDGENPVGPRER